MDPHLYDNPLSVKHHGTAFKPLLTEHGFFFNVPKASKMTKYFTVRRAYNKCAEEKRIRNL